MNSLNISEHEIEELRRIALSMANEDIQKTFYSDKVKELKNWKNIFDDLSNPDMSYDDQLTIDKVDKCLDEIHKSGEDPSYLISAIKKIIDNQNDIY